MREAHLVGVIGELRGKLAIRQPAAILLGDAHPGAEMDLVDRESAHRAPGTCGARTSSRGRPTGTARGPRPSRPSPAGGRRGSRRGRPSRRSPTAFRRCDRVLVSRPGSTPGMNRSQMPSWPRRRIGWASGSQSLKSPTTETPAALGAQTAKSVPRRPVQLGDVRAELLVGAVVGPLGEQVQVEIAEPRAGDRPDAGTAGRGLAGAGVSVVQLVRMVRAVRPGQGPARAGRASPRRPDGLLAARSATRSPGAGCRPSRGDCCSS